MQPVLRRPRLSHSAVFINPQQEPAAGLVNTKVTRDSPAGGSSATVDHRPRERSLRVVQSSSTATLCVVFMLLSYVMLGFAARAPAPTSSYDRQSGQQRAERDTPGGGNTPSLVMAPLGARSADLDSAPLPVETDDAVERNSSWRGSPVSSSEEVKLTARDSLKQRTSSPEDWYTAESWTTDGSTSATQSHKSESMTHTQQHLRGPRVPESWTTDGSTSATQSHKPESMTHTQQHLRGPRVPVHAVATPLHTQPKSVPSSVGGRSFPTQSSTRPARDDPRSFPLRRIDVVSTPGDSPGDGVTAGVSGGVDVAAVADVFVSNSAEGKPRTASPFAAGGRHFPANSASSSKHNAALLHSSSNNTGDTQQLLQPKPRPSPHRRNPEAAVVRQQSPSIPRYIKPFQEGLQSSAVVDVFDIRPSDLPLSQPPPSGPAPSLGAEKYAGAGSGWSTNATYTSFNMVSAAPSDFRDAETGVASSAAQHKGGTTKHSAASTTPGADARQIVTRALARKEAEGSSQSRNRPEGWPSESPDSRRPLDSGHSGKVAENESTTSQCTGTKGLMRKGELPRFRVGSDSEMAPHAEDIDYDKVFRVLSSILLNENVTVTSSAEEHNRQTRKDARRRQVHDDSDLEVDAARTSPTDRDLFKKGASRARYSPDHAGKSRRNPDKYSGQSVSEGLFRTGSYEGRQGDKWHEQQVLAPRSSTPPDIIASEAAERGASNVAAEQPQVLPEEYVDDCRYLQTLCDDAIQRRHACRPCLRHCAKETYSIPPLLAPVYRESPQPNSRGNTAKSGSDGRRIAGNLVPPRADSLPYQLTGKSKAKSKEFWRKLFKTRERLKTRAFKVLHSFPYAEVSPCLIPCICNGSSSHLGVDAGTSKQEDAIDSSSSQRETEARVSTDYTTTETDITSTGHSSTFGDADSQRSYACSRRSTMSSDYSPSEPLVSIWGPRPPRRMFSVVSFKNKYGYDSKSESRKLEIDKLIQRMMRVELWLASLSDDPPLHSSALEMNPETQLNDIHKDEAKEPGSDN